MHAQERQERKRHLLLFGGHLDSEGFQIRRLDGAFIYNVNVTRCAAPRKVTDIPAVREASSALYFA